MTTRDDLEKIANYQRNTPTLRYELVERARAEGITWREIAAILEMSEQGIVKAQKAHKVS